jgi:DNA-binding beta-propeller fold protein YncE
MATKRFLFSCLASIALAGVGTSLWGRSGGFAYVANCGSACGSSGPAGVSAYTIDGTTGALTPVAGSPFPARSAPRSVTADPTGQFAYVANQHPNVSNSVSAYVIGVTTGALTPVASTRCGGYYPSEKN